MSGVPKIEITESVERLLELMKTQKTALGFAKVQALYCLKVKVAETIRYLAVILGRDETTVSRWLRVYKEDGLTALIEEKKPPGRPKKLDVETVAKIQQELRDPEGFSGYKEVRFWRRLFLNIKASYSTVYRCIRYELKSKLKVPRPKSDRQAKGAIETFREKLPERLLELKLRILKQGGSIQKIHYWCGDESRFGLQTIGGRKLTLSGVKPIGQRQWKFDYFYMYGLVEPRTGRSFFYEFSHLDTVCFETFLEQFSQAYPDEIHILQIDNAPSHTSEFLQVSDNIFLLFQPPYCPEVNPIERLWEFLKGFLKWEGFETLDSLRKEVAKIFESISEKNIRSLTGWDFILRSLSLAGL